MEAQVPAKQLQKRKEVMEKANKHIAYLMEQLQEGPRKATLHMRKIMEKLRKKTEEDIEIATATALQDWCGQAAKLQVRFGWIRLIGTKRDPDSWS